MPINFIGSDHGLILGVTSRSLSDIDGNATVCALNGVRTYVNHVRNIYHLELANPIVRTYVFHMLGTYVTILYN